MAQYDKPSFFIDRSFAGYLQFKIFETIYNPKVMKEDMISSLNSVIETHQAQSTELGDLSESLKFIYMFRPSDQLEAEDPANFLFNKNEDAINTVLTVIKDIFKSSSLLSATKIAIGILQYIRKNTTYQAYLLTLTEEERQVLEVSLLEIYSRLKNIA